MTIYDIVDTAGVISLVVHGEIIPEGGAVVGQTTDPNYLESIAEPRLLISRFAFLQRFTAAELLGIELAKVHDPAGSTASQQLAATLRVSQNKLDVSNFVDLGHAETIDGLTQLETVGLIGSGRANQILSAEISPDERP